MWPLWGHDPHAENCPGRGTEMEKQGGKAEKALQKWALLPGLGTQGHSPFSGIQWGILLKPPSPGGKEMISFNESCPLMGKRTHYPNKTLHNCLAAPACLESSKQEPQSRKRNGKGEWRMRAPPPLGAVQKHLCSSSPRNLLLLWLEEERGRGHLQVIRR